MRNYGELGYDIEHDRWIITCEPHTMIRLKAVFPRVNKAQMGTVWLQNTPRTCTELLWFCALYPLKMEPGLARRLRAGRKVDRAVMESSRQVVIGEIVPRDFPLALKPRQYQAVGIELAIRRHALLITDEMGLGKTLQALGVMTQKDAAPALVVVKVGLIPQWTREILRCLPGIRVHAIRGKEVTPLPSADIYLIAYTVLASWAETLAPIVRAVVFDEAHELRHRGTGKYNGARHIARSIEALGGYRVALTGSPVYNYGDEMFSILDILEEGCLGRYDEFEREWCERWGKHVKIRDTKAFGLWLLDQGLMLRRTRTDVGIQMPARTRIIETIDVEKAALLKDKSSALELARLILTAPTFNERGMAARKFDMKLRQSTGVAKAKGAAAYARIFLEQGVSVIIYAWHREVYSILEHELAEFHPVMYTGHETPLQKEASLQAFKKGETKLIFISLGSAEGIDGLQDCCATVIHAELALTAQAHEQGATRVDRPGQTKPTYEIFLVAEEGSDPSVSRLIGVKREQGEGILNPNNQASGVLTDAARVRAMARDYLKQNGIVVKEAPVEELDLRVAV